MDRAGHWFPFRGVKRPYSLWSGPSQARATRRHALWARARWLDGTRSTHARCGHRPQQRLSSRQGDGASRIRDALEPRDPSRPARSHAKRVGSGRSRTWSAARYTAALSKTSASRSASSGGNHAIRRRAATTTPPMASADEKSMSTTASAMAAPANIASPASTRSRAAPAANTPRPVKRNDARANRFRREGTTTGVSALGAPEPARPGRTPGTCCDSGSRAGGTNPGTTMLSGLAGGSARHEVDDSRRVVGLARRGGVPFGALFADRSIGCACVNRGEASIVISPSEIPPALPTRAGSLPKYRSHRDSTARLSEFLRAANE